MFIIEPPPSNTYPLENLRLRVQSFPEITSPKEGPYQLRSSGSLSHIYLCWTATRFIRFVRFSWEKFSWEHRVWETIRCCTDFYCSPISILLCVTVILRVLNQRRDVISLPLFMLDDSRWVGAGQRGVETSSCVIGSIEGTWSHLSHPLPQAGMLMWLGAV